ncbi:hypothetical protein NDU88_011329 [Pleurodeles waltl]|uniref:Uncharacterized protein n=1 Tax=Pleurodeles waltl TaxID=8319 RepID=A0AAV7R028_PLEWA|nr:hypothetical protein NDU88_011329 [Pleurodeles waltl]
MPAGNCRRAGPSAPLSACENKMNGCRGAADAARQRTPAPWGRQLKQWRAAALALLIRPRAYTCPAAAHQKAYKPCLPPHLPEFPKK